VTDLQPIRRRAASWFRLIQQDAARDHRDALTYLHVGRKKPSKLLQRLIGGKR